MALLPLSSERALLKKARKDESAEGQARFLLKNGGKTSTCHAMPKIL